ncbi:MAG: alpha/beta hydrolase [Gammaproteobacteria bacterium]|jgi:pimeloyl-ACP methyl ester carboxylesterase|nr:alpha/beta hydrolase [Gammaproteobacteria bacterium]
MTSTILHPCNGYGQLGVREASSGDQAEPLVLIHGVGMQSAAWQPQIDYFAKTHHVYAIDMPGHGESTALAEGASLPDFIAWLDAVLDCLNLPQTNLVGHSMGALITGGYVACHRERVLRAALVNGVYCRNDAAKEAVTARAQQIRQGKIDLETPLKRWFSDSPSDQISSQLVRTWLQQVNLQGYATAYMAFARGDDCYGKDFQQANCPVLAITGSDDPNSTPAMSTSIARLAKNGKAVVVDGHRHMINITAPERVNAELTRWLATPIETATSTGD